MKHCWDGWKKASADRLHIRYPAAADDVLAVSQTLGVADLLLGLTLEG